MLAGKLMILGGGHYQVPVIRRAVELGCHVITVDYLPDNVGHRHSHQYVNASTTDLPAVLAAARELAIDGIVGNSETSLPAAAFVAEEMGLPGPGVARLGTMINKARLRDFQHTHGLPAPRNITVQRGTPHPEIADQLRDFSPPLIVKPVDACGSRGVNRIDSLDAEELEPAIEEARAFSTSGEICIETFEEGTEVGCDAFLRNGNLIFLTLTQNNLQRYATIGHCLPTNISLDDQSRVKATLASTCEKIGYENGYLTCDIIVGKNKITILEMSPRPGGNGIHQLIERATGDSLLDALIRTAMGDTSFRFAGDGSVSRPCASLVFGSSQPGRLDHVSDFTAVNRQVPEVFELFLAFHPGQEVPEFNDSGSCLGIALFDLPTHANYLTMTEKVQEALNIQVSSI